MSSFANLSSSKQLYWQLNWVIFAILIFDDYVFLDAKHLYEALMSFCLSFCLSPFSENFQNLQNALMKGFKGSQEELREF